jgi:hypothetical protein
MFCYQQVCHLPAAVTIAGNNYDWYVMVDFIQVIQQFASRQMDSMCYMADTPVVVLSRISINCTASW